jgi:CHAT domain-containing protein/Tfp pilus assembly protein PilF
MKGILLDIIDSPNDQEGPEPVSVVSDAPTDYVLALSSEDPKPTRPDYTILLEELRDAKSTDRDYVLGERAFLKGQLVDAEASRAEKQRPDEAVKKYLEAVKHFETALSHLTADESRARVIREQIYTPKALIHNKVGARLHRTGDFQGSRLQFEKMLETCKFIPNRDCDAAARSSLGDVYRDSGNLNKAAELYESVEGMRDEINADHFRAPNLDKLGDLYQAKREYLKAVDAYELSARLYFASQLEEGKDRAASIITKLGQSYFNLSHFTQAREQFLRSLAVPGTSDVTKGNAYYNLGVVQGILGDVGEAFSSLDKAERLTPEDDAEQRTYILQSRGIFYAYLGQPKRALEYVERARNLNQGRFADAEAWQLLYMGFINYLLKDSEKGRELTEMSLQKWEALGDPAGQANALVRVGNEAYDKGDKNLAMTYLERALPLQVAARNRFAQGYTIADMATIHADRGEVEKAAEKYRDAIKIHAEVGDRMGEVETRHLLARLERQRGELEEANEQLKKAVGQIEYLHANIPSENLKSSYLTKTVQIFKLRAEVLMELEKKHPDGGYAEQALQVSDSAKARTLLNLLTAASVNLRPKEDAEAARLLEREKALSAELSSALARRYLLSAASAKSADVAAVEGEIDRLINAWHGVRDQAEARDPRAALLKPKLLSLTDIRNLLDPNTLLLEFALGSERSYLWVVSPDPAVPVKGLELPGQGEIETAAQEFLSAISQRPQPRRNPRAAEGRRAGPGTGDVVQDKATALSRKLFRDVVGLLDANKNLVIVGDGVLNYVPFAGLTDLGKTKPGGAWVPLLVHHEITLMPSASALAAQRELLRGRAPAPRLLTIFAKPLYTAGGLTPDLTAGARSAQTRNIPLVPLVFADDEINGIEDALQHFQPGAKLKPWTGAEVSRRNATGEGLKDFSIIHYSTHGVFDSARPEASGLLLSTYDQERRPSQDYFMGLNDVYGMRLSADLVVLSACQSALGADVKGEGIVGLTRGFMYAGSPRIVSSLWVVNDARTAAMMGRFYEAMFREELPPAAALREAQLFMHEKLKSPPYFWAAFQFQGEWRCATMPTCRRSAGPR